MAIWSVKDYGHQSPASCPQASELYSSHYFRSIFKISEINVCRKHRHIFQTLSYEHNYYFVLISRLAPNG
jgi:hypothetical protein